MTVLVTDDILSAAVDRVIEFQSSTRLSELTLVSQVSSDSTFEGVSIITGIPRAWCLRLCEQHLADIQATVKADPSKLAGAIVGERSRLMLMGWLIRDEQAKAEAAEVAAFDPPAVCSRTQGELADFRFCPHCGIIRVLHSEE